MAKDTSHKGVADLAKKGDGVLVRRGSVWSYPGAPLDNSGTNLRLPVEYVSDEAVRAALADGAVASTTVDPDSSVRAVRVAGGDGVTVISTAQAGTAEVGTELPAGSRPSLDAGAADVSPNDAARMAEANLKSAMQPAAPQPAPVTVTAAAARPAAANARQG